MQNGQPLPSVSSYTKPKVNADGSIDIFFGPNEPKDAGNWIKTVSGKGWLLDDAAEFARTYVGPRLPHRRDRVVHRLKEISDEASARVAARAFRAWAIAEGLLAEES